MGLYMGHSRPLLLFPEVGGPSKGPRLRDGRLKGRPKQSPMGPQQSSKGPLN